MCGVRAAATSAMLVIAAALALAERGASNGPLIVTRHFTPDDRLSGRYQYVPFDVSAAALVRP
jgi:hypothetical protein